METTIVISNYNYDKYVESAIDSCLAQTIPCQIIIVDDCSKDKSWNIISEKANGYKGEHNLCAIRLRTNSNGNARGKNVGICLSNTKYITCLDSDDMLLTDSIETRLKLLKDNNKIDWVHGTSYILRTNKVYQDLMDKINSGNALSKVFSPYKDVIHLPEDRVEWYRGVEASTVLCKKELYNSFGLYDEKMRWKIDREMWYRFLNHKAKKMFVTDKVSIYRQHTEQITANPIKKNPRRVNAYFNKIIQVRKNITEFNTLLVKKYNPSEFIGDKIGKIV